MLDIHQSTASIPIVTRPLIAPSIAAAAQQQYDVRLVGGSTSVEGRVEIYYSGEWGTVCDTDWDLRDAIVVCRQLGYATAERRSSNAEFGQGTGRIWLDNVDCSGTESMLSGCFADPWGTNDCVHSDDAGVVCAGKFVFYMPVLCMQYKIMQF